jgi:ABC-2 type transport system ATP-binding protein
VDDAVTVRAADGTALVGSLIADLGGAGVTPIRVEASRPTLDDVFLDLTGRSLREAAPTTDAETDTESEVAA